MLTLRLCVVISILLASAGCMQARQRYDGTVKSDAPVTAAPTTAEEFRQQRIVLFAPTSLGPLAAIYPAARLEFPFAMADRVDLLMKGHDGRVGEALPDSDAARWSAGRVPATAGAHVVVLTQVLTLERIRGGTGLGSRPDRMNAVVELRALDVNGVVIYRKRALGQADVARMPKVVSEDGRPESRAAWEALTTALSDFRTFLSALNELANQPVRLNQQPAESAVPVIVDSDPAQADVLIDGAFRGTTPLTLMLPAREVRVRIERQGFLPWERMLVPSIDMRIQPALVPVPAAEQPPAG